MWIVLFACTLFVTFTGTRQVLCACTIHRTLYVSLIDIPCVVLYTLSHGVSIVVIRNFVFHLNLDCLVRYVPQRYVECSGRAQAVWHRSWRLHEPNNGVVQFSVPASALEKNAVVRVALSAQAPAAGGRGGQGARAGARGAAYEASAGTTLSAFTAKMHRFGSTFAVEESIASAIEKPPQPWAAADIGCAPTCADWLIRYFWHGAGEDSCYGVTSRATAY